MPKDAPPNGWFPCSLLFTRSRRSLTLPLRPRRAPIEYETEYYRQVNSRQQATPQTFSTASSSSGFTNPEKFPNPAGWGCATPGPDPPGSSRSSVERLYNTSSSRTPLDPRHLAVLTHPGFVGAAPTLADTSRLRLPPASAGCCDSPQVQVFHLHSNSSASRRTKPALNAFAVTFEGRIPTR
jgi:hypothetical protein